MQIKNITRIVKDNESYFRRYADGNLTYAVFNPIDENYYEYDVPVEETKGGVFIVEEKALHHMRWIRKAIESNTFRLTQ